MNPKAQGNLTKHNEGKLVRTALSTAGHEKPFPPPKTIQNSFSRDEIRKSLNNPDVDLIVHHGPREEIPGFDHLGSHREISILFSNRMSEISDISVDRLVLFLKGSAETHRIFPGAAIMPKLFCHGDSINLRVLGYLIQQPNFSLTRSARAVETFTSYKDLAYEASKTSDVIVAGLRGEGALTKDLKMLKVNGVSPFDSGGQCEYPLQYLVHIYARLVEGDHSFRNEFIRNVEKRIEIDEAVIKKLIYQQQQLSQAKKSSISSQIQPEGEDSPPSYLSRYERDLIQDDSYFHTR